MKGLFINSPPALCSIYESGVMSFKALSLSSKYELDYIDYPIPFDGYDFIVVNWHHAVCNWLNLTHLENFKGKTFCIVTEMRANNPLPHTPDIFDKYLVLDPTLKDDGKFFGFSRPIEIVEDLPETLESKTGVPVIGSFGFLTRGKRWDLIVEEVCKDFDEAHIRFNIPFNSFPDGSVKMEEVINLCKSKITKEKVTLEITHHDMNKEELIRWCAENTINVFFYWRDLAGLAAVTDQAVSAIRPLLCSNDLTFRHVNYICKSYPDCGIKEAIFENEAYVKTLWVAWSPENFMEKFESIL